MDTTEKNLILELYEENMEKLYKFFYYKSLNKHTAEELVSSTFMEFIEKINKEEVRNYKAYLYGIARNIFYKHLRKKYTEISLDQIPENFAEMTEMFLSEIDHKETKEEKVFKYIEKLPDKQKELIELRLIQKNNLKEICEILKKNMNYVKTTQRRAIQNLKKYILLDQTNANI